MRWDGPFWNAAVLLRGVPQAQRTLLIRQVGMSTLYLVSHV